VAVANTLDAMTSDSLYRLGGTFSEAAEEIRRCAGSQFDPEIVKAFLNIPNDIWLTLRTNAETLSSF
jgi:HD-GYP domain-containing protein (c-di-GMP phosphodiesterase class II)